MKKLYFLIALTASLTMTAQNDVTFSVDMNGYGNPFTTMYVSGELNGWSGTANPMVDMGGGIWSATISLADGEYQYKFSHDDWAGQDNLTAGSACTVTDGGFTNRYLSVNGANQTLDTVSFSTCYDDGNPGPHDITLTLDMNAYPNAFTTVYVSGGTINGWSGDANPMINIGGGIWSVTLSLAEVQHEFKFTIDNWTDQENFMQDAAGTVTNGGFTNRFLNALGAESRAYVWNAEGSTLSTNDLSTQANFTAYPNPSKDSWNITTNNTTINSVRVYDISGRQVLILTLNTSTVSIDGTSLKNGIYFAKVQTEKGQNSIKLIKN